MRAAIGSTLYALVLVFTALTPVTAGADTVRAAVAANFTAAFKQLAPLFERESGHRLLASFGATGQLYAQIDNGAPFDVFLAADVQAPQKLCDKGSALPESLMIYANGRLALWSAAAGFVDTDGAVLASDRFAKLAIANPKTAPYGRAAIETLEALGVRARLQTRLVTGENIAQTQQFIASGNAQLGFIALSQVMALAPHARGSHWTVPPRLHQPIEQGAVVLAHARSRAAAQAFLRFLRSPVAVARLRELGYEIPAQ